MNKKQGGHQQSIFGSNLLYLRRHYKLSQTDVAEWVGKGHATVSNWEKGVNLASIGDAMVIAEMFKISVEDLLYIDLNKWGDKIKKEQAPREGNLSEKLKEGVENIIKLIIDAIVEKLKNKL